MKQLFALAIAFLLLGCASQNTSEKQITGEPTLNATEPLPEPAGNVSVKAEKGDAVAVDYLGTLEDGTVFDTSIKEEAIKANLPLRPSYSPLEFTVGAGQMIKGFDAAVVGMAVGEEKTVRLEPDDAYGERREDLVISAPRSNAPEDIQIGSQVTAGNGMPGTVIAMDNETVTVDFNHNLAGEVLNFKIIMRKISKGG
ncbi:MAG: peptidylprolyl isomerase [Candidatus Micrarchaeota archaeon]